MHIFFAYVHSSGPVLPHLNHQLLDLQLLLQFIEICGYMFMRSSHKVLPQDFSQAEVWTLTGIIVFSQTLAVRQMNSHLTLE